MDIEDAGTDWVGVPETRAPWPLTSAPWADRSGASLVEVTRLGPVPDSEDGAMAMVLEIQEMLRGGLCNEETLKNQLRKRLQHGLDTADLQHRVFSLMTAMEIQMSP